MDDPVTALIVARSAYLEMIAHALDGLPLEACGLLEGPFEGARIDGFHPCVNAAASAKVYTVEPRDQLRITRSVEDGGADIVGVMHSHTHTTAYPSPTDVAQAPDPTWHYIIVSLRHGEPVLRSFRIIDGAIGEEPVLIE